jgi:hypothetical protein
MVWKRKSGVENGEPPRKRGRPRKNANAVEVKEDGTAAAPLEIKEVSGRRRRSVTIVVCSGLKFCKALAWFIQNVGRGISCTIRS